MFLKPSRLTSDAAATAIDGNDLCDESVSDHDDYLDNGDESSTGASANLSSSSSSSLSRLFKSVKQLTLKETCYVTSLKLFILMVLAIAGAFVARATHRLMKATEETDFEEAVSSSKSFFS